jgi:Flp pilus assembly protein TadG
MDRARKGERGTAAVEFALVMMPLLLLALGGIDFGNYFFVSEVLANAAREAARAGAIVPNAVDNPGTAAAVAASTAQSYINALKFTGTATITTTCPGGVVQSVCIQIAYPAGSITGFLSAIMPTNATAQAVMRLEP